MYLYLQSHVSFKHEAQKKKEIKEELNNSSQLRRINIRVVKE
jgi:hypothetical protein